ncbi:MAG: glycosyltransferase [Acidimicrobiia bacterium]|nr:glycosyltransferase [Acidimicrobiia bacterium]
MSGPDRRLRRAVDNAKILAAELARARAEHPDTTDPVPPAPGAALGPAPITDVRSPAPAPTEDAESRPRAVVVAWDLGHNPAGRALVLTELLEQTHDTVLLGPLWPEHGRQLWRPLRDHVDGPVLFPAADLGAFVAHAFALAARTRVDTVHISKPRLPSVVMGAMMQRANHAGIVLDIDDDEMAFFAGETLTHAGDGDPFADPTGAAGTRWAVEQSGLVDVRTVSNAALRAREGGVMVRHARDEQRFDPAVADRTGGRARLHARDDEFVILFVGTPRPHKGLDRVVEAVARLDDRFVLHVVGAADPLAVEQELGGRGARVRTHPPCGFEALPDLLAAADALALLQDPDDPIARWQIPAKISDGLALGRPVLVAATPPLADLHHSGVTVINDTDDLVARLQTLADEGDDGATDRRLGFLSEFSHAVNGPRLAAAHREAAAHDAAGFSERVLAAGRDGYERHRRTTRPDLFEPPPLADGDDGAIDVAFFWKQNDSDLYGRRADMIAAAMADSPRFGRIVHFDAPVDVRAMAAELDRPPAELPDETPVTHQNILDRHLRLIDHPGLAKRVFVYGDAGDTDPLSGDPLPSIDDYPAFVAASLVEAGLDPSRTMAWVCPIAPGFDRVRDDVDFSALVVDIIDDQRVLHPRRSDMARIDEAYAALLPRADALFTNCEPNVSAFAEHATNICVVPNGAEVQRLARTRAERDAADTTRTVVYVGDMRSRVDWTLVEEVIDQLDGHRWVFAGSTDGRTGAVERLAARDDVEFVGIVPYPGVPDLLATADVAIVPHLTGPMTERMNPLKVYNYLAAGLPVVATGVDNIDDVGDQVTIATDAAAFAAAVATATRHEGDLDAELAAIDWSARLDAIVSHLEACGVIEQEA